MKKYVALGTTLAALAWAGVAAGATAQGKLTGSAFFAANMMFNIESAVIDGGTSFVGLENDKSGNCNGDSGTITDGAVRANIVCAHYVASSGCCNTGSRKVRLAYFDGANYVVVRITDNGAVDQNGFSPDTFAYGETTTFAGARAWVNKGRLGGGAHGSWNFVVLSLGDFTVVAQQ